MLRDDKRRSHTTRGGRTRRGAILALAAAGTVWAAPAAADPVAEFYRGKTIVVVSAGEVGGAHGAYAQLIAAHIKRYIPGDPSLVIQYMVGAGGNLAMNYLYNVAPKDGTYVGVPLQDLIVNARIGVAAVKYDAAQAHYLGGADVTRTTVTVMKASGIHSLDDAKRQEVLMGASGKSGQNYVIPTVLNSLLGTQFRIVSGYPGIAVINLAMERGEVHGHAVSWPVIAGTKKEWIEKGLITSLVTIAMEREPELPDVPALAELVSTDEDRALIELLTAPAALGRAWVAFGDIPNDRLAALREAWRKTMADPAFREEAAAHGLVIRPVDWQAQQELARRILATPNAVVARLKGILGLD
jgi:tripartite-type tricarboxylate transporter receptor subunit TctC